MVYRQAFALLGVPRRDLENNAAVFEQISCCRRAGLLQPRSWYPGAADAPRLQVQRRVHGADDGLREGASFGKAAAPRTAPRTLLVDLPSWYFPGVLVVRFARAERLVAGFFEEFGGNYADFWERTSILSLDPLVDVYLDAEKIMGRWRRRRQRHPRE